MSLSFFFSLSHSLCHSLSPSLSLLLFRSVLPHVSLFISLSQTLSLSLSHTNPQTHSLFHRLSLSFSLSLSPSFSLSLIHSLFLMLPSHSTLPPASLVGIAPVCPHPLNTAVYVMFTRTAKDERKEFCSTSNLCELIIEGSCLMRVSSNNLYKF